MNRRRIGEAAAAFTFIAAILAWAFVLWAYGGG